MQYLAKMKKRNYFYAAFTIRKAREEAVGDRLIALVCLLYFVLLCNISTYLVITVNQLLLVQLGLFQF